MDEIITHSLHLERMKVDVKVRVFTFLKQLEAELVQDLVKIDPTGAKAKTFQVARLRALLRQTRESIKTYYSKSSVTHATALTDTAKKESEFAKLAVDKAIGVDLSTVALTHDQLLAVTGNTIIQGAKSRDWWAKQAGDTTERFKLSMQLGVARGETLEQLVARVRGTKAKGYTDGVMAVSRRNAEALVRTSVQAVANKAREDTFKANTDVIKGFVWLSTLDGRTSPFCIQRAGLRYDMLYQPIGHSIPWLEGPGRIHWGCRSSSTAILKSWDELAGKTIRTGGRPSDIESMFRRRLSEKGMSEEQVSRALMNSRASMDGYVPKDISFADWLKGKSAEFQDGVLGAKMATLWRSGRITTADLVSTAGRELSVTGALASASMRETATKTAEAALEASRKAEHAAKVRAGMAEAKAKKLAEEERVRLAAVAEETKKLDAAMAGAESFRLSTNAEVLATKISDAAGSNPGGFYVGKDGVKRYVKFYKDGRQAYGEAVANSIYRGMGLGAPESTLFQAASTKQFAIANKVLEDAVALRTKGITQETARKILNGYITDVFTMNWDAVGTGFDNVVFVGDRVYRIDQGGALLYSAKGALKSFDVLGKLSEIEGFASESRNPAYARVLKAAKYSQAEWREQLKIQIAFLEDLAARTNNFKALVPRLSGIDEEDRGRVLGLLRVRWAEIKTLPRKWAAEEEAAKVALVREAAAKKAAEAAAREAKARVAKRRAERFAGMGKVDATRISREMSLQDRYATDTAEVTTALENLAREKNMSKDAVIEMLQKRQEELVDGSDIWIRMYDKNVSRILSDGRWKSQFETGQSGGQFDPAYRKEHEAAHFGVSPTIDVKKRPTYGYLTDLPFGGQSGHVLNRYGRTRFKLKASARERATYVWGDSFFTHTGMKNGKAVVTSLVQAPAPVNAPHWTASYARDIKSTLEVKNLGDWQGYVEVQIFDGVTLADVEEVVLVEHKSMPSTFFDEVAPKFAAKGIKVTLIDQAGSVLKVVNP